MYEWRSRGQKAAAEFAIVTELENERGAVGVDDVVVVQRTADYAPAEVMGWLQRVSHHHHLVASESSNMLRHVTGNH